MKSAFRTHMVVLFSASALLVASCMHRNVTFGPAPTAVKTAVAKTAVDPTVAEAAAPEGDPTAANEALARGGAAPTTNGAAKGPSNNAAKAQVGPHDWNQWGGSPARNNVVEVSGIPQEWDMDTGKNIKWVSRLGSQSYGNPVIANGKAYVGTNNGAGYLKRYPADVDLGCLLCFNESDGKFLWQHSSEKLPTGRVHDWPFQGICATPLVEGNRVWFVTSRGEVACLDAEGFHDDENDGPYKDEDVTAKDEADAIWYLDMMRELGISQHNMCSCSLTSWGDTLFVITGNGVDDSHIVIPAPEAPSFIAVNKNTGKVLWTDSSPGLNIIHGQWSSPAVGVLGGVPQVICGGGDGYLYSFHAEKGLDDGKPELLWKFDLNDKKAKWVLAGRGDRNEPIATPVLYNDLVYIMVGQDPEHGEGDGRFWCIDPTKRGDVSPQLVFNQADPNKPVPHKRIQACEEEKGDFTRDNPNSAVVWEYSRYDANGDNKFKFDEKIHRGIGTCAIKDDVLYVADFSGLVHCLDAKTGERYWVHDMLAASWGSILIADGKVYIGDEDGDVTVFAHHAKPPGKPEILTEINLGSSVFSTPVVANGVLYIASRAQIFAIKEGAQSEPVKAATGGSGDN